MGVQTLKNNGVTKTGESIYHARTLSIWAPPKKYDEGSPN